VNFVKKYEEKNATGHHKIDALRSHLMTLRLINEGKLLSTDECQFSELNKFCSQLSYDLTFEWINGQYWLHSDIPKEKPIGIEIDQELLRHEEFFKKSSLQKELLARAIGIKGPKRPPVLDLTAGLLGDSLLLLSFGLEVWAVERHPVIRFLIQSAIKNASHPAMKRFHFIEGEASEVLNSLPPVEVIYFDPMFEDANSKTSPRKEMRIFRSLVGKDQDAGELFQKALDLKPKRLVVKRPRQSVPLSQKAQVEYLGKSTRYDVYFSV
jgi:16S rRNA (guanine1516-N2)-methyltransferase